MRKLPQSAVYWGALGVLGFSLTLPATRAAAPELGGAFVGLARAIVAALCAGLLLMAKGETLPPRRLWGSLALTALGVVIGFPLCSALAMAQLPASHGAVLIGLMPAATALMAVVRAGERPQPAFWAACVLGVAAVLCFAVVEGAGLPQPADALLLASVFFGALGYAEGGKLARELGGWRVICWALVGCAPLLILPVAWLCVTNWQSLIEASPRAWAGFAYVSLVSMFGAFFAWYRGLAEGGVARIGQIQLLQPVGTLLWSALLLGERLLWPTIAASLFVVGTAALTQRVRGGRGAPGTSPVAVPVEKL